MFGYKGKKSVVQLRFWDDISSLDKDALNLPPFYIYILCIKSTAVKLNDVHGTISLVSKKQLQSIK